MPDQHPPTGQHVQGDYLALNRANWDQRAPLHAASRFYDLERYRRDPARLSEGVEFDRPLLGDVTGLRGVHLQCHLGTDTLSLARLGARMSGLDFSAVSLARARALAEAAGARIDYVEAEVDDATRVLPAGSFDLVYTGTGALCWLPSMSSWAASVAALLTDGGRLFLRETHPVLMALAQERTDGLLVVERSYFERDEPGVYDQAWTYTDSETPLTATVSHQWNHGLGDVVGALLAQGLEITGLVEHQSLPWEALSGQMTPLPGGEWQLSVDPWRLPHSYTLQAVKRG